MNFKFVKLDNIYYIARSINTGRHIKRFINILFLSLLTVQLAVPPMLMASNMSSCNMQADEPCCCSGSCNIEDETPANVTFEECSCGDVIISQDKILINQNLDFSGKALVKRFVINPFDDNRPEYDITLHSKEFINSSYDAPIFLLNESFLN